MPLVVAAFEAARRRVAAVDQKQVAAARVTAAGWLHAHPQSHDVGFGKSARHGRPPAVHAATISVNSGFPGVSRAKQRVAVSAPVRSTDVLPVWG